MRKFLTALPVLALGACSTLTQSQWTRDVSIVQSGWPVVSALINADLTRKGGQVPPAVVKAEATITSEVAGLSATSAPTSPGVLLSDVQALVDGLPSNVLSAAHQAELAAFFGGVQILLADVAPAPVTATP